MRARCYGRVVGCRGIGVGLVLLLRECRRSGWRHVVRGYICRPGHRCPSFREMRVDVRVRRHGSSWSRARCRMGTGCWSYLLQSGRGMVMWVGCSGYEVELVRSGPALIHACDWPGSVPGERLRWGGWSGRYSTLGPGTRLRGGQLRSWSRGTHS